MTPDRLLSGIFSGVVDGKEVNVTMAAVHINGRSTWLIDGDVALVIEGIGVAAAGAFLDAIAGVAVELEPSVKDRFQGLYTVPSQADPAQLV